MLYLGRREDSALDRLLQEELAPQQRVAYSQFVTMAAKSHPGHTGPYIVPYIVYDDSPTGLSID